MFRKFLGRLWRILCYWKTLNFRKIIVSVKFVSAILGPEMAAPILWTPGKMRPFCRKSHVHKIPRFRGGVFWVWGGGECQFHFYGRADFSENLRSPRICLRRGPLGGGHGIFSSAEGISASRAWTHVVQQLLNAKTTTHCCWRLPKGDAQKGTAKILSQLIIFIVMDIMTL